MFNWPFRKKKRVEHRFSLGTKEFRCLIRGGQLTFANQDVMVHLILNDIGFDTMKVTIGSAELECPSDWVKESVVVKQ